jgi:ribosomal protein S13
MEVALTYIYGIGRPMAKKILAEASIELSKKSDALTEAEVAKIREIIDRSHRVEGDLRREVSLSIKRLELATVRVCQFAAKELIRMLVPVRVQQSLLPAKSPSRR